MSTATVRVDWVRDHIFLLRDRSDFPIIMTQPMGVKGSDLLTLSLIGCTAWDIVEILKKQRQRITEVQVTADTTQDDDPPWRFRKVHILYKFTGRDLNADSIHRAIELSEKKYCSVYETLRETVDIKSEFEIANEQTNMRMRRERPVGKT